MVVNKYWRVQTMTRDEQAELDLSLLKKYGIRQSKKFTEQELKDLCPKVPSKKKKVIKFLYEDDGYHD